MKPSPGGFTRLRTGLAYGFVSGTCFLMHNGIMIATDWAGRGRLGALGVSVAGFVASNILVSITGYLLHSHLTFRQPLGWRRYWRYAIAMSTNTPMALGLTWALRGPLGLPMTVAAPAASCVMIGANFLLSRWAIAAKRAP